MDDGTDPPLDRAYFPVGLALSSGGDRLYLANSNFDLQFNAGTIQVLDAARIRRLLPVGCTADDDCDDGRHCDLTSTGDNPPTSLCVDDDGDVCGSVPRQSANERNVAPGICGPVELDDVLLEAARIAPFVTDLQYTLYTHRNGQRRARLLMPVRGDATLHWADVENDADDVGPVLACGQGDGSTCDDDHRRGDRASEGELPDQRVPTEPFSLAVAPDGRGVVVAHQLRGIISLFRNGDSGPELQFVLDGLPMNPMGLAALPAPALASASDIDYAPGFFVTYRHSGQVIPTMELLRYFDEEAAAPGRPFLQRARTSALTTASSGVDSRGVAVDDGERRACETSCIQDSCGGVLPEVADAPSVCVDCVTDCAKLPVTVYVANRSPASLLIGETGSVLGETFRDDVPDFSDAEALRGGPSRVYVRDVIDEVGNPSARVFVVSFDARLLYVYDPFTRLIEARLQTGRGPHALEVDQARGLGYLAHFTDSYIGVLDLDKRRPTYGQFLLTVGKPTPPRSSR